MGDELSKRTADDGLIVVAEIFMLTKLSQSYPSDVRERPYRYFTVSVLTDDVGVHALRVDAKVLP